MLKKLIALMKENGQKPPFFLFSSEPIEISEFSSFIEANFVLKELPKDVAYLTTRENIHQYYRWTIYNDCSHGYTYKGQCNICIEEENKRKIEWEIESDRIRKLIERKKNEGFKSFREMLIHDSK